MTEEPRMLGWIVAGALMIIFSWTALSFLFDNLPWKLIDKTRPGQKIFGIILMTLIGLGGMKFCVDLLKWVWIGLKHILFLDIEEI